MRRMFLSRSLDKVPQRGAAASHQMSSGSSREVSLRVSPSITTSSSFFFEKLKSEEQKQFPSKKRRRTHYTDNVSAALAMSCSLSELRIKRRNQAALLSIASPYIIEHANRRVDLFFYTLIAYHLKQIHPITGHTNLQHGRGRHATPEITVTEGCHSSFTPSLVDETIYETRPVRPRRKSLLSGTHFMNSLNSTVELPSFVNEFDNLLESSCRPRCIELLTEVSLGRINPLTGMRRFLNMMDELLNELKIKAESQNDVVKLNLIKLIMQGTLSTTFVSDNKTVSDTYLQLVLRLTESEKQSCTVDETFKETIYAEAMLKIQEEILSSGSTKLTPF